MPITYDLSKDLRFKQGRKQESRVMNQNFVINLLRKNIASVETIAEFADVSESFVVKTKAAYLLAVPLIKQGKQTAQQIADETGLMLDVVEKLQTKL